MIKLKTNYNSGLTEAFFQLTITNNQSSSRPAITDFAAILNAPIIFLSFEINI